MIRKLVEARVRERGLDPEGRFHVVSLSANTMIYKGLLLPERLVKVAVWVQSSVRRIVLHFPTTFPWLPTWRRIARAVGATT